METFTPTPEIISNIDQFASQIERGVDLPEEQYDEAVSRGVIKSVQKILEQTI